MSKNHFGYTGNILRIDLTKSKVTVEHQDEDFYRTYLGGEGLIAYYLLRELPPRIDPLGLDNKLIFAAGVLTGTPIYGSSRSCVGAKSPLTNGFGSSEGGGFWGTELKKAGYDAVIIEGKASRPCYISIRDENVEIRDASKFWKFKTAEAEDAIWGELEDDSAKIAQIGIAGTNLARYACIGYGLHDYSGRTGMGAVMGSKYLRAIAVKGTGTVEIYDREGLIKYLQGKLPEIRALESEHTNYGTAVVLSSLNLLGGLPSFNFREGYFEEADGISGEALKGITIRNEGCYACPVRCKRVVKTEGPYNVDPKYGGPEYETIGSFGSCCGIGDIEAIAKANELCNAYGLDTISTGVTIAFAMECFENGLLTKEQTGGVEIRFGNAAVLLELIPLIAEKKGIGELLAEGVERASRIIGLESSRYAMHVKGQELPMHEPKTKAVLGVGYAVSPTGADHCHNVHDTLYEGPLGFDLTNIQSLGFLNAMPANELSGRKARLLYYVAGLYTFDNCAVLCMFIPWTYIDIENLMRFATGWNYTTWEILKTGHRASTLARCFNMREGFTSSDDVLPERIFRPFTKGRAKDVVYDKKIFLEVRNLYYNMMGWNEEGIPTLACLYELGIEWAKDFLR
jgi:aldehyde:ferredoxin oxidoreductase